MNSKEFSEILRTMYCLSLLEYEKMFGNYTADRFWNKKKKYGADMLFHLDEYSMDKMYKFAVNKIRNRKLGQRIHNIEK